MPRKATQIDTVILPLRISSTMLEGIDMAIKLGQGNSRSEIIRMIIAQYLRELNVTDDLKKKIKNKNQQTK